MRLDELIIKSNGARVEIFDDYNNCSEKRFLEKTVYDKLVLFNGIDLSKVSLVGRGNLSLSSSHTRDNNFCLCLSTQTDIDNINPRPQSTLKINLNHLNLEKYNRFSVYVYVEATGYEGFYFHFATGNDDSLTNHAPIIIPNQWNHITWECDFIKRNDVNTMNITPFLMGTPPEGVSNINVYIDEICCEVVDKEFDYGWNLDERIAYSHVGYLPTAKKIAITQKCDDQYFNVINIETNKIYKYKVKEIIYDCQTFKLLDFSLLTECGRYVLEVSNRKTEEFLIDLVSYDSSIWKSLNFLRLLRCGEDLENVHSACHLNCKSRHDDACVPTFGGWHDAGDVSQFEICTAEMAQAICELAQTLKFESFLFRRLLEEARVGLNWLLRTKFNDGYRALAVTYKIMRSNIVTDDNTSVYTQAEAGSFESLLAASSLASGAKLFSTIDKKYADWLKRTAIDDFKWGVYQYENNIFTKRWGKPIESQTLGTLVLAASLLYELTNEEQYIDIAKKYSLVVMECQEKGGNDVPIKGFFYEDTLHNYVLSYEHRGHEQSPIQGLCKLYSILGIDPFKEKLKKSIDLYRHYIIESMKYSKVYNLLPGGIYHLDKINIDHFTIPYKMTNEEAIEILKKQVCEGINLGGGWYLRMMPIALSRRGFHATLLSKTKAVSSISKLLNDQELKNISISQLEWILGKNPFASSTMYGEGHNYHPLYVAFSRQIVGALPVGIKTKENKDIPYWPNVCNAVFKEIWGHTTGKYLWVLADIL